MRIIFIFIACMFLVFALLQLNDPDPWTWVPIYGYPAVLFILAAWSFKRKWLYYLGIIAYIIGIIIYIPDLVNWINMGAPSITGSMHAETPYIELTREFFGLVICLAGMIMLLSPLKIRR